MKLNSFFKLLNKKIKAYENATVNPFAIPQPITIVWIDETNQNCNHDKNYFDYQ